MMSLRVNVQDCKLKQETAMIVYYYILSQSHLVQAPHHPGRDEGVLQTGKKQDRSLDFLHPLIVGELILEEELRKHLDESKTEDDFRDIGNVGERVLDDAEPNQGSISRI